MGILPSDYPVVFEERALADTIAHQLGKIDYVVREPSDDALLSTPTEDMVERAYRDFRIQPVIISKAGVSRKPVQLGAYRDDDRNHRALENAFKFEVGFPFTGAMGMFNHHVEEPPPRRLRAHRQGDASAGELLIAVHGEDLTKEAVKEEVDREINDIIAYMERINEQVIQYNNSIRDSARAAVNKRKDQILKARDIAASLGYEMQRRPDAPPTYITQELQRVIRPRLIAAVHEGVRFDPEPTIDEEEYKHILEVMSGMALMMERSPRTFTKLKEEEIRDHFLLQLNGHYKGNALGETFNRKGKTDILVREKDKNLFIGECKIWKSADDITEAVNQLLRPASISASTAVMLSAPATGTTPWMVRPATSTPPATSPAAPSAAITSGASSCSAWRATGTGRTLMAPALPTASGVAKPRAIGSPPRASAPAMPRIASCSTAPAAAPSAIFRLAGVRTPSAARRRSAGRLARASNLPCRRTGPPRSNTSTSILAISLALLRIAPAGILLLPLLRPSRSPRTSSALASITSSGDGLRF